MTPPRPAPCAAPCAGAPVITPPHRDRAQPLSGPRPAPAARLADQGRSAPGRTRSALCRVAGGGRAGPGAHRVQHSAAFLRMNELELASRRSTSGDRSRAISTLQMLPSAHSARPTVYWLRAFRSFFSELVTSMSTSWRSSSRIISPRYPIRCARRQVVTAPGRSAVEQHAGGACEPAAGRRRARARRPRTRQGRLRGCARAGAAWPAKRGPARLLREAVGRNELQRLHLTEVRRVAQHVDVHELGHVAVPVQGVLLAERIAQGRALLGDDVSLLRGGLALPDIANQLPARQARALRWLRLVRLSQRRCRQADGRT